MPTVAKEGGLRFVVNTRENLFEPPHVHVWVASEDVCRIELNSASYMDEPPPGLWREILEAYRKHAVVIRQEWTGSTGGRCGPICSACEECGPHDDFRARG